LAPLGDPAGCFQDRVEVPLGLVVALGLAVLLEVRVPMTKKTSFHA